MTYPERLNTLDLQSLEFRRIVLDLLEAFRILKGLSSLKPSDFFTASRANTRQHLVKVDGKCAERMYFFSNRVVDYFNVLPENVRNSSSFTQFKTSIHKLPDDVLSGFLKGRSIT